MVQCKEVNEAVADVARDALRIGRDPYISQRGMRETMSVLFNDIIGDGGPGSLGALSVLDDDELVFP